MTEKIFYNNPYLFEYETEVKEVIVLSDKKNIILKETIFYPEGGGQPCDLGYINDEKVNYVYEDNDHIIHQVDRDSIIKTGDKINIKLDKERRLRLIKNHTGQHILSNVFQNVYNASCTGLHMGDDYVSIDIKLKEISQDIIEDVEDKINDIISQNLKVTTYITKKEDLYKYPLRKITDFDGEIRIVRIGDIEYSTCCGLHTLRTGDIGIVKIIRTEKYKGMTRVYFKCGKDALKDYEEKNKIIKYISGIYSSEQKSLVERIELEREKTEKLNKDYIGVKKELLEFKAQKIINENNSDIINLNFDDISFKEIDELAKAILKINPKILIFTSRLENKILFSSDKKFGLNCGLIFKEKIKEFNGNGGGAPNLAQGSFKNVSDLELFVEYINLNLTK